MIILHLNFSVAIFCFYYALKRVNSEHCQMDQWMDWEWSNGQKTCGVGKRRRYVKVAALHGGESCEKRYGKNFDQETKEIPCVGELIQF